MLLLVDALAIRLALYYQIIWMRLLLLLPDSIFEYLPYTRRMIEEQVVGSYWLLNKNTNSIPREAADLYKREGRILLFVVVFIIFIKISAILKCIL